MPFSLKTPGVVIKTLNFGEADKILTIFTERFGKVKALAKGVRKIKAHLAGSLEPFMLINLQLFEGKTFYTITGAEIEEEFENLHNDLKKTASAFYVGELIDKFEKDDQKSPVVFKLLTETLFYLNNCHFEPVLSPPSGSSPARGGASGGGRGPESSYCVIPTDPPRPGLFEAEAKGSLNAFSSGKQPISNTDLILRTFEVKLLQIAGFWGDFSTCIHCHETLTPEENYWDGEEGGIICGNCQKEFHHGRLISDKLIKVFRFMEKEKYEKIINLKFNDELKKESELILSSYLCDVLESEIKSKSFIKEL